MIIVADTNVLVRAAVLDDAAQAQLARNAMGGSDRVVVTLPALCEFVWVLSKSYRLGSLEIATSIRQLIGADNIETDLPAVEAGLAMLDAGGDFADGVIAFEGRRMGGETFVSFDRKAVGLLAAQGVAARLPG